MTTTEPSCPPLTLAIHSDDPVTLAFAGVITQSMKAQRQPLIRGLNEDGFRRLSFPALTAGTHGDAMETWLAHAITTAAMCENHLWQDKGLPNRKVLAALRQKYVPSLAALNNKDMKWKKFFYRQLCQRAGVLICKSPHCAEFGDYRICFWPENR